MENFNKTWPFITAIVGFGILIFSIFSFMVGMRTELKADIREVKTELNARIDRIEARIEARMDNIEGKLDQLILLQAQRIAPHKPATAGPKPKRAKRKPAPQSG